MIATGKIKEKIKKLLALAESPNEHEAMAALLKARQLMAEHKLTEAECKDIGKKQIKDIQTEYTFSKRKNPWMNDLSAIISINYCCAAYQKKTYGKQTRVLGFIGLQEDVEICVAVFRYAVESIMSKCREIKRQDYSRENYYVDKARLCNSYSYGFAYGVQNAFEKQTEEKAQEWGLVLSIPQEVKEATQDFEKEDFHTKAAEGISATGWIMGYEDGKRFDPKHRIREGRRHDN